MTTNFRSSIPYPFFIEWMILSAMFLTLLVAPQLSSINTWEGISPMQIVRGSVWLVGLAILPGAYVLRVARISKALPFSAKAALGINLSLLLVGLVTLLLYTVLGKIVSLPWLLLGLLLLLGSIHWAKTEHREQKIGRPVLSKWNFLLIAAISANIVIAFYVQTGQQYLVPGDNWVGLQPAIQIISEQNVYQAFEAAIYPLFFGFILAGLSASSGLPVVNTYVLLFPLVALNILSFFVLVKIVFRMNDQVSVLSTVIYGFSGGLGWLYQTLIYEGELTFRSLSLLTQDMYNSPFFWHNIQFSFKSLSLTLVYASLVMFVVSAGFNTRRKAATLMISSFYMVFSFFIHMIEAVMIGPVIIAISYFYGKGRSRYISLAIFLSFSAILGLGTNTLMSGFYSWLAYQKLQLFLSTVRGGLLLYALPLVILLPILLRRNFRPHWKVNAKKRNLLLIKLPIFGVLLGLYFRGLFVFGLNSSIGLSSAFPWYLYVSRYGFIGAFAIVGVFMVRFRDKWFGVASFWALTMIIVGSVWWGTRTNSYLLPILAIFAGIAVNGIWRKADITANLQFARGLRQVSRNFKVSVRNITTVIMVILLSLSFTSTIYGANNYIRVEPPATDSEARTMAWIHQNTPENATILVPPEIYSIHKGIGTIGDRNTYFNTLLPVTLDTDSFVRLIETLQQHNILYAVEVTSLETSSLVKYLISYSTLVFKDGNINVYKLPQWNPPLEDQNVAVLDRRQLGLAGQSRSFGWADDSFAEGWFATNVDPTINGETLTLEWEFQNGNSATQEPVVKKNIPELDTNKYPHLIVRFRNDRTSPNAENSIRQIITLINQTAYPEGFIDNFFLPVERGSQFKTILFTLPENQIITELWIWMRNYQDLTGTISLEIDYIGFASRAFPEDFETQLSSLALSSSWPIGYSIFSEIDAVPNASVLITSYDVSVVSYVSPQSVIDTFLFVNATAGFPEWGNGWRSVSEGIVSGHLNGKTVIIIGLDSIRSNKLSETALKLFELIEPHR